MEKRKIRILHVAQAAGGVDRYLRMLLKYLDKDRFENIVVVSQDFKKTDYAGLASYFEQVEMSRAIGGNDIKAIREVRKLIKHYNPDIVYAHSSKAGAIARVADMGLKNHCIYNPHGWAFNMRCSEKKRKLYTAIEKIAAPFCDKIICISDAEKQSALDKKICREDKLQVIYNGVDIEAYENGPHGEIKRTDLGIPDDAFVVGMVGRISPQKAPDVFIQMAKVIKEKVDNTHFIIVGNGEEESEMSGKNIMSKSSIKEKLMQPGYAKLLFKKISEYGLQDCIHFIGVLNAQEIVTELKKSHVMVLPSSIENSPNSLCEAQLVGIPTVASYVGGVPEMLRDGKDGFLYAFDEPLMLAEYISRIFDSDEIADSFSKSSYAWVRSRQGEELVLNETIKNYRFIIDDWEKENGSEKGRTN